MAEEGAAAARDAFNREGGPAEELAAGLGLTKRAPEGAHGRSRRFSYLADGERFAIVVGEQEHRNTDLALAHGLRHCGKRKLVLVLPKDYAFATLQRAAWLKDDPQPEVWVHDGSVATHADVPSAEGSVANVVAFVATRPESNPDAEFRNATSPVYVANHGQGIVQLVEWATRHPKLDGAHRQGERAWHCMGQKVLSIRVTRRGALDVRAGIHWSDEHKNPALSLAVAEDLDDAARQTLETQVEEGIQARLKGDPDLRDVDDEHWLQAVLRRRPEIVGVEQPALREVPAWRPVGAQPTAGFQRGYVDLLGLDGHGDVRIVETKLATNVDDLLVFQGLDYLIWAQAYDKALRVRLGAPTQSDFTVHYVLGADQHGNAHESGYVRAQVDALRPEVVWRSKLSRAGSTGMTLGLDRP